MQFCALLLAPLCSPQPAHPRARGHSPAAPLWATGSRWATKLAGPRLPKERACDKSVPAPRAAQELPKRVANPESGKRKRQTGRWPPSGVDASTGRVRRVCLRLPGHRLGNCGLPLAMCVALSCKAAREGSAVEAVSLPPSCFAALTGGVGQTHAAANWHGGPWARDCGPPCSRVAAATARARLGLARG